MAVKLSSYYWFRNNYLVPALEDKYSERAFFGEELSPKDKKILKIVVDELDKLKKGSYFQQGKPVIGEHVLLFNVTELKDVTSDSELAAKYLETIYKIMKQHWVNTELYRQLGNCFDEIKIEPNSDIKEAVKYVKDRMESDRFYSTQNMCWDIIKNQ